MWAKKIKDQLYDVSPKIQQIQLEDGYVDFTKHFKYLGLYVSYNLRDDYDINLCIAAGNKATGALKTFGVTHM